jgi:DNA-binding NarL/FixJ family response regulator
MPRECCLIGVEPIEVTRLTAALADAVSGVKISVAFLDIGVLSALAPEFVLVDIDSASSDPIEALRQLRFVLPNCIMFVYTRSEDAAIVRACHSAGANCLLSKRSSEHELTAGMRHAIWSGCFTDPHFIASAQ